MSEATHAESSSDARRDVTRLVNFSDAVVAIAATLLVLPLVESAQSGSVECSLGLSTRAAAKSCCCC